MMNRERTRKLCKAKYLLSLPLVASLWVVNHVGSVARTMALHAEPLPAARDVVWAADTTVNGKKAGALSSEAVSASGATDMGVSYYFKGVFPSPKTVSASDTTDEQQYYTCYMGAFVPPEFPGGSSALIQYLCDHVKYPEEAQKNNVEGQVVVRFVVRSDGSIDQVKVVQSVEASLDSVVVRAVKDMPRWKPGMAMGEAVSTNYQVPVSFRLTEEDEQRQLPTGQQSAEEQPAQQ